MIKILDFIDKTNETTNKLASLLFVPMTLIAVSEVIMRYVFNSPTTWAWDVNVQLFALMVVFGAGSTLFRGGHVAVDLVVNKLSPKKQILLKLIAYAFFIFSVGVIVWQSWIFSWRSVLIREKASTLLSPVVYPLKIGIFCGVTLLWLQGISLFVKEVILLLERGGRGKDGY